MGEDALTDNTENAREEASGRTENDGTADPYLSDLREIENILAVYDLNDAASNRRLYRYLRKQEQPFSSWIGRGFMAGLEDRSRTETFRRNMERVVRMVTVSFGLLAVILIVGIGYLLLQEGKENAVLEYIREERRIAEQSMQDGVLPADTESEAQDIPQEETESGFAEVIEQELEAEEREIALAPAVQDTETAAPEGEGQAEDSGDTQDTQQTENKKPQETSKKAQVLPEYAALYNIYPDFIGWLTVPGTKIDYPVMRERAGEEFYLKHNFQGESDSKGSLFIDAGASVLPQDRNVIIFGHNMKDGSMFGSLSSYLDQDFYAGNHTIRFDTIYEKQTYEVVAVVRTAVRTEDEKGFRYYWFYNYSTQQEFDQFAAFVEENRLYHTGIPLAYGDSYVMLSTCEYSVDNGRLVVIARKQQG